MNKETGQATVGSNKRPSLVQQLYDIAMQCDVSIARCDGESLCYFAERLVDEIAEKIIALNDRIDDIQNLDLEDQDDAS